MVEEMTKQSATGISFWSFKSGKCKITAKVFFQKNLIWAFKSRFVKITNI